MGRYKRERAISISRNTPVERELSVIIAGQEAGTLREHGNGYMSFEYADTYHGPWLSLAIPNFVGAEHLDLAVRPVFEGLLPDNPDVRREMARSASLQSADTLSLLEHFGKDLPGAVQVCRPEETESVIRQEGRYVPVTDSEIAHRLVDAADMLSPVWHGSDETWSLGGHQGKFALARVDGKWMRCEGACASTHILKPGVSDMPLQALVEFATMQAASRVGLDVAQTEYAEFCGVGAIVVERYDRIVADGSILRLHQEDLCQALGYLPSSKYDVTTSEVIGLLSRHAGTPSVARFADALMFNYLVGGIDAHAKNYSIVHMGERDITLAPLYDLASVLPYEKIGPGRWRKIPMSIGGVRSIGALTGSDLCKFAEKSNLPENSMRERMRNLAQAVPDVISDVGREYRTINGMNAVISEMSRTVSANCQSMLANIDRDHSDFVSPGLATINGGTLPREHDDNLDDGLPDAHRLLENLTGFHAMRQGAISSKRPANAEFHSQSEDLPNKEADFLP